MDTTLKIALCGVIVSTISITISLIVAVVQIFNYRRDRAKVKVRMFFKPISKMYDKSNMTLVSIVDVLIANAGRRPVTIIKCYIKAGRLEIQSDVQASEINWEIGEGKSYTYTVKNKDIDKFGFTSKDLYTCVLDATHKRYWSDPIFIRWIKAIRSNRKIFKKRGVA